MSTTHSIEIPDTFVVVDDITSLPVTDEHGDFVNVARTHTAAMGVQNQYQRRTLRGAHIVPSTLTLIDGERRTFVDGPPDPQDAA